MIARLTGKLHIIGLDEVVVDVHGVGYHVHVPIGTAQRVRPDEEGNVALMVHTAVREDAIQLFGFASAQEKWVYRKLISVSGVGPKLGLNVLSDLAVPDIIAAVRTDDFRPFTKVTGIGKKTAQRLLLELRTAFDNPPVELDIPVSSVQSSRPEASGLVDDLRSALTNLQYPPALVENAIEQLTPLSDTDDDLQGLVRRALKLLRG